MTPTSPQWTVLSDASNRWMLAQRVSILLVPAAILLVVAAVQLKPSETGDRVKTRQIFLLAFFIGTLLAITGLWITGREITLASAVTGHRYTAVVGHITSLVPPIGSGRVGPEKLVVRALSGAAIRYQYVNSIVTLGFSERVRVGRPIRVGDCASIADANGTIARLAVADQCDARSLP